MTISRSEWRNTVGYEALKNCVFEMPDVDSVGFMIGTDESEYEEMVEVECLNSGLKTVYKWEGPGLRVKVALESPEFNSWSEGLRLKVGELLEELASWEARLRRLGEPWEAGHLADPNFSRYP